MSIFSKTLIAAGLVVALAAPSVAQDPIQANPLGELLQLEGDTESTEALPGWNTCNVVRTGAGWGNHYAMLACPGESTQWFQMNAAQKDAMLATALSAISTSKDLRVYAGAKPTGSSYHELLAVYIVQ